MYNEKMAVAIKSNGSILKEFKDKVYLKFGSEYSIYIKNLNNVRALVKVYIDGTEVTSDGLVINANSEVELERSIVNLDIGNRFKFIERTDGIEQHRGIKLEDGLVKIEYQFEKIIINPLTWSGLYSYDSLAAPSILRDWTNTSYISTSNTIGNTVFGGTGAITTSSNTATASVNQMSTSLNYTETGITVPGSESHQKFTTVASFNVEPTKHCMILHLLGETPDNKPVIKTVTVKSKPKCVTCGKQNKAHAKFCNSCGTSLNIFT